MYVCITYIYIHDKTICDKSVDKERNGTINYTFVQTNIANMYGILKLSSSYNNNGHFLCVLTLLRTSR